MFYYFDPKLYKLPEPRINSDNAMPNVTCQTIIQAPQADVFAIAQDYGVRLEWDTFSRSLAFKDGATRAAAGVRATGRAWNGIYMEVEYLIVTPPTVAAMTMIHGPFFFATFSGSWQFKKLSESTTEVIFKYHYITPWAALRPLIDSVIGFVLTREINRRLRDLKHAAEQTDILDRVKDFRRQH